MSNLQVDSSGTTLTNTPEDTEAVLLMPGEEVALGKRRIPMRQYYETQKVFQYFVKNEIDIGDESKINGALEEYLDSPTHGQDDAVYAAEMRESVVRMIKGQSENGISIEFIQNHLDPNKFEIEGLEGNDDHPYVGIIHHDVLGSAGSAVSWTLIKELDSYPQAVKDSLIDSTESNVELMRVLSEGMEHNGKFQSGDIKIGNLIESLIIPTKEKIKLSFDKDVSFDTLEEYITVRTLLGNAVKEMVKGEIEIGMEYSGNQRVFFVRDNAGNGEWTKSTRRMVRKRREGGKEGEGDVGRRGGLGMVAFLAGKKGTIFKLEDERGKMKSVSVGFVDEEKESVA